jgi:magnesium transporter
MQEQIIEFLEQKKYHDVSDILKELTAPDVAALLDEIPEMFLPTVYRLLPKELAAEVFVEMDVDQQEMLIHRFTDTELRETLDELYLDDTVDIIEEMPATVVKRILRNTDPQTRFMINQVLKYPKDSAGSLMTIEYVSLKKDMTVEDAFTRIRRTGVDKETIYTCYVTDANRRLEGIITVRTLLLANSADLIGDIMEDRPISVATTTDREEVVKMFDKYDFLALPVVDQESRLVGIITVDDAMDVMQEEADEDFAKMAAVTPSDESYFKTTVFGHAKNRIIWLLVLMMAGIITGAIITGYEEAFQAYPMLVAFIPMLMGTGGNAGAQSSTLTIRGMATDEIQLKDYLRVAFKEARISLIVGAGLSVINFIRVYITYQNWMFGVVTGLSLICTIFFAKLLGCSMPMLAKKLKLDPAIMASPLITTLVDAGSILLYFSIATALLKL